MSERPRKLRLFVSLDAIEGYGEEITYKLRGHRRLKSGRVEHYEVDLISCRHGVLQLMDALRKMHERDRERLASEGRRIEREIKHLTDSGQ